ncbi:MAG: redoxin family protein [Chloroflexota bacterium]|nr:redoxin family protein [Chloroflexota bacterium]
MELQRNQELFQDAGVKTVALAVAPLSSVEGAQQAARATYPILADPAHQVAEAYGVYNLLGDGLAAPSVFIIDTDKRIVWSHVGQNSGDRPGAAKIMEQLAGLED